MNKIETHIPQKKKEEKLMKPRVISLLGIIQRNQVHKLEKICEPPCS